MTTEPLQNETTPRQTTSDTSQPGWGAPKAKPAQRWSGGKTAAAVAIAAGVAGVGGAVIWVGSGSNAATTTAQALGGTGAPGGQGGPATLSGALHGRYVVSDGNGGYTTELMQVGKVTAISATSLTATSADGFSQTYTIDAATATGNGSTSIGSVATGKTVTVVAKTTGDTATAESVSELGTAAHGTPPAN
jgi:hypothetical protein